MTESKRTRKSGRNRRSRGNPRNYSQLYKDDNSMPSAPSTPSAAATAPAADDYVEWSDEYGYVFNDLKLLLIVSVVIFAIMIGAGLILG